MLLGADYPFLDILWTMMRFATAATRMRATSTMPARSGVLAPVPTRVSAPLIRRFHQMDSQAALHIGLWAAVARTRNGGTEWKRSALLST